MSDLDDELSRTLHRHAENVSGTPLAFDDVRGQATSIRRRRRLATGLGVAAAVAVIVPTAMFATNGNDSSPQPASQTPTVTDTNTPSPSSTPTMGSDPHALGVTDLPTGAPPAVGILDSNQASALATTQEATVSLLAEGVVVEAGGRTFGPYPSSHGLAVNAAATAVAWSTDEGDVMVWADGAGEPFTLAGFGQNDVRVAAITGTDCLRGKASDCEYFVSHYTKTGQPESLRISGDGGFGNVDPDRSILAVRDATDSGLVLGITEFDDSRPGTCSVVLDPAESGSTPLLGTCDYALDEFSPDGSYVLASDTYGDGFGSGVIAIFATAGDRLSYRINRGPDMVTYNDAAWEDETHVLFTRYQDGKWSIVRMDVQGAMEYAIPPQKGGDAPGTSRP